MDYDHDPDGRRIAEDDLRYAYDAAGQLVAAVDEPVVEHYTYDGNGRRRSAETELLGVEDLETTYFTWDPTGAVPNLVLERDGESDVLRRYTHGRGLESMTAGGESLAYHPDRLGSTRHLTDAAGDPVASYAYEPFGTARSTTADPGAPENRMRFAGEYLDTETGFYHLRARQYDPGTGRFTRPDPLDRLVGERSVSSYAYADNRPTVLVDPLGLRATRRGGIGPASPCLAYRANLNSLDPFPYECMPLGSGGNSGRHLRTIAELFGVVPFVGDTVDALLCGYDLFFGDRSNSLFSCAAIVPVVGGGALAVKYGVKYGPDLLRPLRADDAISGRNLGRQLASEQQLGEAGIRIAGPGTRAPLRDAPRLASQYGGSADDWVKMSSSSYRGPDGLQFETHWYQNLRTGQRVEFKTKFSDGSNMGYGR